MSGKCGVNVVISVICRKLHNSKSLEYPNPSHGRSLEIESLEGGRGKEEVSKPKSFKIVLQHKCKTQLMERDTQYPVGFKCYCNVLVNCCTFIFISLLLL